MIGHGLVAGCLHVLQGRHERRALQGAEVVQTLTPAGGAVLPRFFADVFGHAPPGLLR